MISEKLLNKYLVATIELRTSLGTGPLQAEEDTLRNFLSNTDYIAAKLAESTYLGEKVTQDYTEVLQARQYARERIDEIVKNKPKSVDEGMF